MGGLKIVGLSRSNQELLNIPVNNLRTKTAVLFKPTMIEYPITLNSNESIEWCMDTNKVKLELERASLPVVPKLTLMELGIIKSGFIDVFGLRDLEYPLRMENPSEIKNFSDDEELLDFLSEEDNGYLETFEVVEDIEGYTLRVVCSPPLVGQPIIHSYFKNGRYQEVVSKSGIIAASSTQETNNIFYHIEEGDVMDRVGKEIADCCLQAIRLSGLDFGEVSLNVNGADWAITKISTTPYMDKEWKYHDRPSIIGNALSKSLLRLVKMYNRTHGK